jgi:hypothetical protein
VCSSGQAGESANAAIVSANAAIIDERNDTMADLFRFRWANAKIAAVVGRRDVARSLGASVIAGLTAFSMHRAPAEAKKRKKHKLSKRKRCRKKKRTFCAGRCCPKHHRCEYETCVESCFPPCAHAAVNTNCWTDDAPCFCATSLTGASVRLKAPEYSAGNNYACPNQSPPCSPTNLCPSGQLCATCWCGPTECNYRCFDPCPPG